MIADPTADPTDPTDPPPIYDDEPLPEPEPQLGVGADPDDTLGEDEDVEDDGEEGGTGDDGEADGEGPDYPDDDTLDEEELYGRGFPAGREHQGRRYRHFDQLRSQLHRLQLRRQRHEPSVRIVIPADVAHEALGVLGRVVELVAMGGVKDDTRRQADRAGYLFDVLRDHVANDPMAQTVLRALLKKAGRTFGFDGSFGAPAGTTTSTGPGATDDKIDCAE